MVGSLLFLTAGFFASISSTDPRIQYGAAIPPLLIGLVLWSRNQAYLQRWGPRTRQDGTIARALRGIDARYHLFVAPASGLPDYVLLGPMGAVVLVPRLVNGTVTCHNDRWRHDDGRPLLVRLLLWFAVRPSLGDPTAEAERGVERLRRYLAERVSAETAAELPIEGLILFTHPQVNLVLQGCRVPALLLKSLRSHVRRLPRALTGPEIETVTSAMAPT
jgi:hypothetical protein